MLLFAGFERILNVGTQRFSEKFNTFTDSKSSFLLLRFDIGNRITLTLNQDFRKKQIIRKFDFFIFHKDFFKIFSRRCLHSQIVLIWSPSYIIMLKYFSTIHFISLKHISFIRKGGKYANWHWCEMTELTNQVKYPNRYFNFCNLEKQPKSQHQEI